MTRTGPVADARSRPARPSADRLLWAKAMEGFSMQFQLRKAAPTVRSITAGVSSHPEASGKVHSIAHWMGQAKR